MSEIPAGPGAGERVVVGVDGSENSKEALREAARFSQALGAPLEVLMCWQEPAAYAGAYGYLPEVETDTIRSEHQQRLDAVLEEVFGEHLPGHVSPRLVQGRAAEALIEESRSAQLLVVGRRGLGGVLGMVLGSVSNGLVSHAHCSVLVVRH
jgi:nucleotide-binding universal stress UspA family protein